MPTRPHPLTATRVLRPVAVIVSALAALPAQPAFLMVKPGDPAATAERAALFLDRFATYLRAHVPPFDDASVLAHIANTEELALQTLERARPVLVFAPFGFYLEHLRAPELRARVVAHVPRFGTAVERFYLVAPKAAGVDALAALRGKTVHAAAGAIDLPYLRRVVLPRDLRPGDDFELEPSANLADDVFVMTEGGPKEREQAPDALLLDEELLRFFRSDDLVWPQLEVMWSSQALPRDVVVALGDGWDDASRARLRRALFEMGARESGEKILELMRSDGFATPDAELLARTAKAYDRAAREEAAAPRAAKDRDGNGQKRVR